MSRSLPPEAGVSATGEGLDAVAEMRPWLVLLCIGIGLGMVVLDVTILNVAIPSMCDALGASLGQVEWALIGYSLTLTGFVPVFGRLGDMLGRRKLFLAGLSIFTAGSLLCALSATIPFLVAARIVQAIGGALISSNSLAILTDVFPPGKRGVAMGMQAIMISGGAATGPVLGGILVTRLGWRSVFLVNIPIGILAFLLAAALLPPLEAHRSGEPVDGVGAVLLVTGLGCTLLGLTRGPEWGWSTFPTMLALFVGVLLLMAFLSWERRVAYPVVDLALFRIRAFSAAQLAGILATLSISSLTFLLPFYWQGIRGFTAERAGLLMIPLPLAFMLCSPLSGWLSDRFGPRRLCTGGLLVASGGLFLLSLTTPSHPVPMVLGSVAMLGMGLGFFMAPNNNAIMSSVPEARRGVAAGLLGTMRYTGQSLGVALGGTLLGHVIATRLPEGIEALPSPGLLRRLAETPDLHRLYLDAFTTGFSTVCRTGCFLALLAASVSWWVRGGEAPEGPAPGTIQRGD